MHARHGIRYLFVAMFLAALSVIVVQDFLLGSMSWLCASTLSLALVDNCWTRFSYQLTAFHSGFRATCRGMIWAGACVGIASTIKSGLPVGFCGLILGTAIGLLLALIPVSLIALIPGQKLQYLGERNSPRDKTTSSNTPYIGGQG